MAKILDTFLFLIRLFWRISRIKRKVIKILTPVFVCAFLIGNKSLIKNNDHKGTTIVESFEIIYHYIVGNRPLFPAQNINVPINFNTPADLITLTNILSPLYQVPETKEESIEVGDFPPGGVFSILILLVLICLASYYFLISTFAYTITMFIWPFYKMYFMISWRIFSWIINIWYVTIRGVVELILVKLTTRTTSSVPTIAPVSSNISVPATTLTTVPATTSTTEPAVMSTLVQHPVIQSLLGPTIFGDSASSSKPAFTTPSAMAVTTAPPATTSTSSSSFNPFNEVEVGLAKTKVWNFVVENCFEINKDKLL